ncbi:GNAT family N-acetyltransferase [Streptomyces sp. CBMA152]|uniref:GNAT family N-acetyltransferase n=1 Tax=Streptomyces sp. CBMA152 TaxID=1896312 RepID=UPI00166013FE|nr:GNAT family N-acetyltransferase [Streptomyces sp. CBMA152]MBD0746965.1 GNAT family N-acetyltransferase [Streptomyces sp. CBMA152]MBD0747626.1 GNAT family N-acetyltransferase [Streptomyces sp. CBMA152]
MESESVPDIVAAWIKGWVVSRGAAEPVAEPWGWTIDVGQTKHVSRHVVPEPDEPTVRKLVEATTAPATWLKLFADDDTVRPWLGPGWHYDQPGFLMTLPLAERARTKTPRGYTLTSWTTGGVLRVLVRTDAGHFAARGQLAPTGTTAVADQIETAPEHRRRGLGSLVMRTLQNAALEAGATTAVLVGTPEGQALYSALGWTTRSAMASLYFAPSDPASSGA